MVCVWLLFTVVLFVAEPFVVARHFRKWATDTRQDAFKWLHRMHRVLLALTMPDYHLRCGRRQPGMIGVLMVRGYFELDQYQITATMQQRADPAVPG